MSALVMLAHHHARGVVVWFTVAGRNQYGQLEVYAGAGTVTVTQLIADDVVDPETVRVVPLEAAGDLDLARCHS